MYVKNINKDAIQHLDFQNIQTCFFFSGSLLTKIHQPINYVYHQNETMFASKYSLKETTMMV